MLQRVLDNVFRSLTKAWHRRGRGAARNQLRRAFDRYAEGNYAEACMMCEAALALEPDLADASCLLGVLACRGGNADSGARAIERALALSPANTWYLAALADARLLQQRAGDAQVLYSRAFPRQAADIAGLTDANLPWKRTHPDWLRSLLRVTLPLSLPYLEGAHQGKLATDEVEAGHLLNWALVLVSHRRVRQAIYLLQQAVMRNPRLGYAHAVMALLHTLNRDWQPALAAAKAARGLDAEAFPDAGYLCILAAQFGTGRLCSELDPVFDWSPLTALAEPGARHLDLLPRVEGVPFPAFPESTLVFFIACDPRYFFEYGIALACSIRENGEKNAIHFHIFNPTPELWPALDRLRTRVAPLMLSVTWEFVEFDQFGGISLYCIFARFSRLYQLLLSTTAGIRVVMLDADSLVRGDLASALARGREIGLAHAEHEPFWHQYLGGFATFRTSPAATRFLHEMSSFLATNLAAGRARRYLDQIALYACVHRRKAAAEETIDSLPVAVFCDTLFGEEALIWSVTQKKGEDSPFDRARRAILERYNQPIFSSGNLVTGPASPAGSISPDAPALLSRGYSSLLQGDHACAMAAAREILSSEPRHPGVHVLIAQACGAAGDVGAAEDWIARLLALDPGNADAHYVRGMMREQQGELRQAMGAYDRALESDPSHTASLDRKGGLHDKLGEFEASLACARRLIELDVRNPDGHYKAGLMLRELGRLEEAGQSMRHALALQPDQIVVSCHLAQVLVDQGRFGEAGPLLSSVLSTMPEYVEARWVAALLHLLQAQFDLGWEYYESRESRRGESNAIYGLPEWDGQPIRDGTLLIYSEQGLGDEIMFASCFGDTLQRTPFCVIECEPRLEPLFRRSFPRMTVRRSGAACKTDLLKQITPPVVAQIASGSLPALFRRQWADFPRHEGYLVPDPVKVAHWRERLHGLGPGLKVGLAWTGGALKTRRRLRSIDLAELRPLLMTRDVHFVSLQYVESEREITELRSRHGLAVHHWPEAISDYDETAALVAALDLVISVCTATVHLSGASAKPVWVMVPAAPEWRYLASGGTMPWYPTARLFRQQRLGEWKPVIERIAADLTQAVGARESGRLLEVPRRH